MNNHTIVILAFNNHILTMNNIEYLIKNGYERNIFLFDNGSSPSFIEYIKKYNISYHREEKNIYVNPAWNKIFNMVKTKYITLLNNDCFIISKNYFNQIIQHMDSNDIVLSSCKTFNIKNLTKFKFKLYHSYYNLIKSEKLNYFSNARRQGWLMTINLNVYKKLNYIIPDDFKIWYGDDWIWSQILTNNLNYVIYKNRYALHLRNKTISNQKFKKIIDLDKENFVKHKNLFNKNIYQKSRIFNRYV